METIFDIPSGPGNPRNSEGTFLPLPDGRIRFYYTRYRDQTWADDARADIVMRESRDDGRTWSDFTVVIPCPEDSRNVMSVSVLRLQDGRVMMHYLKKDTLAGTAVSCMPYLRFSEDDGETWSEERPLRERPPAYQCVNNDRIVQLSSGRLLVPVSMHNLLGPGVTLAPGMLYVLISDDNGATWRDSKNWLACNQPSITSGFQEPGLIELDDGRVMMWIRCNGGCQFKSFSSDGGDTWLPAVPAHEFPSTEAPLSMKRDPATGRLVAIWCDRDPRWHITPAKGTWERTPLGIACSDDDARSWHALRLLEDVPIAVFCDTAILFTKNALLLAYCCGHLPHVPLQDLRIRRIPRPL